MFMYFFYKLDKSNIMSVLFIKQKIRISCETKQSIYRRIAVVLIMKQFINVILYFQIFIQCDKVVVFGKSKKYVTLLICR